MIDPDTNEFFVMQYVQGKTKRFPDLRIDQVRNLVESKYRGLMRITRITILEVEQRGLRFEFGNEFRVYGIPLVDEPALMEAASHILHLP